MIAIRGTLQTDLTDGLGKKCQLGPTSKTMRERLVSP